MSERFDPYYTWLGIRPEEQPANHYRLLGLKEFEDNPETIQNAADRQMAHLRTFQGGKHSDLSQKLLNEVAAAKLCLLVGEKRAVYDAGLRQQLQPEGGGFEDLAAAIEPLDAAGTTHHVAVKPATPWGTIVASVSVLAVLAAVLVVWRGSQDKRENDSASPQPPVEQTRPATSNTAATSPSPPTVQPPVPQPPVEQTRPATSNAVATSPSPPTAQPPAPQPLPPRAGEAGPAPNPGTTAGSTAPGASTAAVPAAARPPAADGNASKATGKLLAAMGRAFFDAAATPVTPQPPAKLPIPPAEVQQALLAQVNATFPSGAQVGPREQIDWAKQLILTARQEVADPNQRFAYFRRAAEVGCSAGDVGTMLQAVDNMGRDFQIDVLDVQEKMLTKVLAGGETSVAFDPALAAMWRLADRAVADKRFELALAALQEAQDVCATPLYAALRKDLHVREGEMRRLAEQWPQAEAATAVLKQNNNDPQANLALGCWYWFKEEKPEQAWPYLAKGSDETLKKMAQQELSPPVDAEAKGTLGDAWLSVARVRHAEERNAAQVRAAFWYQRALDSAPEATTKLRVEKRLDEIIRTGRPLGRRRQGRVAGNALRLHLLPGGLFPRGVWVDLLEYADPQNGVAKADQWKWTEDGISGGKASGGLPLRVALEGNYDMEVQFTRLRFTDAVVLVFVVNGRQCALALNAYKTKEDSFQVLEGQLDNSPRDIVTSVIPGEFSNNQRHTVLVRVRLIGDNASVEARFDGKPLLYWVGPQTGVKRRWGLPRAPSRPALAAVVPVTVHSVRMRLLTGKGEVGPGGVLPPRPQPAPAKPAAAAPAAGGKDAPH